MEHGTRQEAYLREQSGPFFDVLIDKDVFPWNQSLVEDDNGIVLIQTTRQRIIKGTAHHLSSHGIRRATEHLHPRGTHGGDEGNGKLFGLDGSSISVSNKVVMRQSRAGGDHFRATDDEASVGLSVHMDIHVSDLIRGPVTVYGRVDKRVVQEQDALLGFTIPASGIVLVGSAEIGMQ